MTSRMTFPLLPVLKNLREIRRLERADTATVRAVQERLLPALVQHAVTRVPYYRRTVPRAVAERVSTPEDLHLLPILDREIVNAERPGGGLLADGFGPANTRQHTTSGSSGVPITMYNSDLDLGYLRATYLQDMLSTGLRPTDRVAYCRPGTFLEHPLQRFGVLPAHRIDTTASLDDQVDQFLAARPTFLTGFPTTIASVVDELRRRGIDYRGVRRVVFGGERLTPVLRDRVLGYFGASGLEVYAAVETFTIARSCRLGQLHIRPADMIIEVEQPDGSTRVEDGEGDIVVTRLRGEAMPLLRYRLGDRVRIEPNDCRCGQLATPILREVLGRRQDLIYQPDGRGICVDVINMPLVTIPELVRLQVVQERLGELLVRVVLAENSPHDTLQRIAAAITKALPDFDSKIIEVNRIEPGSNGKVQVVRSAVVGSTHLHNK